MATTMRAVDIKESAGPAPATALFINASTPKPTPKAGEALVKIKAFGLNRMDLLQRMGMYPVPPGASTVLGVEFSGWVEEVVPGEGGDKEGFKKGDEVFGLAYGGAYAEYIAVSTHMLIHKPKELSWEVAAGMPETWITALQAIHLISKFQPGESILWHAGASSVSIAGIQLIRSLSPQSKIYVTASSQEKIDFCKTLGADAGFNYKTSDWSKDLLSATDEKGVDVIIDFIGASYFQQNLDAIARDGRIVHLGAMGGTKLAEGTDIGAFVRKRVAFLGSGLRSRDPGYQGRLRDLLVEEVLPRVLEGVFEVKVERCFSWRDVAEAHGVLERNETRGKVVCWVD